MQAVFLCHLDELYYALTYQNLFCIRGALTKYFNHENRNDLIMVDGHRLFTSDCITRHISLSGVFTLCLHIGDLS